MEGIDRRCAGSFLKDSRSGFYLAHSGKVGGGRKGIGKTNFLDTYSGSLQEIEWPDGITQEVVLIGKIGGKSFIADLSSFIRSVEAFKASPMGQLSPSLAEQNPDLMFSPEFEGRRTKYTLTGAFESECRHGTIVNALQVELEALGFKAYNTRNIDLMLADDMNTLTHLFEVKTDQTTTSLYQAVGQVLLNGALRNSDPQRIVVLPGKVSTDTARRMKKLGIKIVQYDWMSRKLIFDNLEKAISQ